MSQHLNDGEPTPPSASNQRDELMISEPPTVRHRRGTVTTGDLPAVTDPSLAARPPRVRRPLSRWLVAFAIGNVVLGCLAGVLWFFIVPLSTYQVLAEGQATITERGLASFVAGDAWFVILGLVLGIVCGLVVWSWCSGLGWVCVPLAVLGSTLMGLLCWQVGALLGPDLFNQRLAEAAPGDVVPIDLTVRGPVALLMWPFGAVLVLMMLSALVPDPEDPVEEEHDATH